ncbi:T9SS type A sorting domain-containing protein [Flavobacterium sp. FlaQc-50]|uniref:T9SS type A sorting domain-containing protein n=1 Tax=unclassified Flavobacterium TaxID=196869 RepID=UPI003756D5E8
MKIKLLLLFLIFAGLQIVPTYAQGGTVKISNLRYTNGKSIPNGSPIEIYQGESVSITFDLDLSNPQLVLKKGYLYVFSKKSSSESTSLQYVNVDFNNNLLSSWYSKEFTVSMNASAFNATGGIFYGQFSDYVGGGSIRGNVIPVKVIPIPAILNNSIWGNQTITEGQSVNITGSNPSGGIGNYSFEWQKKDINGGWVTIAGAKSSSLSSDTPFVNTSYKRIVKSGVLGHFSNEVAVTVTPAPIILNNTITLNGSTIHGSLPTGGINVYQYSWILWGGEEPYTFPQTGQDFELTKDVYDYLKLYPNLSISRIVTSGSQTMTSVSVKILPIAPVGNNTISISGSTITGSQPTGGNNSYQYSWMLMGGEEPFIFPNTGQSFEITEDIYNYLKTYPVLKIHRIVTSGNQTSGSNSITILPKGSSAKTAIASEKSVPTDVTVYPNPTTQSVNFTTNFSANKEIEITIFSEGLRETKSIFRGTVTPNQVVNWNFPSNYPKGLYFYKIMADNKEVKSGKISFQ